MQSSVQCPYCGVGCAVRGQLSAVGNLQAVSAAEQPNRGQLCQKGSFLAEVHRSYDGRALFPLLREAREQPLRRVSWQEAAQFVASRLLTIQNEYGRDAIAWYGSGQLDSEAAYVFSKLFKGYFRTNNADTNSRLCMASAAVAYTMTLGSDGPPCCYADIDEADVILILGANMAVNHPVLFERVRARRRANVGVQLITIDPRFTDTAAASDLHVPVKPGGDVALLLAIAKRLLALDRINRDFIAKHCEGYEDFFAVLNQSNINALLTQAGVTVSCLERLTDCVSKSPRFLSLYCQGLNQSTAGVDKNLALIQLHLLLGAIGRAGAGPFSLTGQPNAMGGREVGYLSHQLPGYRRVDNATDRAIVEVHWQIPAGSIQAKPGLAAVDLFAALAAKNVRAIWIAATNPVVSMPNAEQIRQALRAADFVVVQDCYQTTETTRYADVILPAAQWGEKTGTMTNSERLVRRSAQLLRPPGQALPDWAIACMVARAAGFSGFDYVDSDAVWSEYIALTAGQPCDQSGMSNRRLQQGPLYWPCISENHPGQARRYLDKRFATSSGRARFFVLSPRAPAETTNSEWSMTLLTGRIAAHWHTRTRTGRIAELNQQEPEPFAEIHPQDAQRLHIKTGQHLLLESRRGCCVVKARVSDRLQPGTIFVPFHWGDLYHHAANINNITQPQVDPKSKQPELKYAAIAVRAWQPHSEAVNTLRLALSVVPVFWANVNWSCKY